ncbi:MAG: septum formation initiator family protein [Lachnospiraceae bacterium]|nr:septum formation initiator family protein [Lachnospiraceae bacterium]
MLGIQIKNMEQEDKELAAKVNGLQTTYEQESSRTEELEAQKIYVQTKQYIEEMAKKLGLVYPDEIILKPAN